MAKQTMGEFLSILRKAGGYTQQDIAEKLNVSAKTVSSWETDRTCPDLPLLPILADIYGVTCDELLRGERDRTSFEGESEGAKSRRSDEITPQKEKLLAKVLTDFNNTAQLLFSLSSGCSVFFLLANATGERLSKINQTSLIPFQFLSLLFMAGFSLCLYFLLHYYRKAYAFYDTDYISLRYRRSIILSYFRSYHNSINALTTMCYVFCSYLLGRNILISHNPEITRTLLPVLMLVLFFRILPFYLMERGWERDYRASLSPEDSVIFRKKRALVKKRFYLMQGIVSAICLLPVFLFLFGVITVDVKWALAIPVLLLLQKIPIHIYYAEGRGMKHIVLPEEAPIEQEKSA